MSKPSRPKAVAPCQSGSKPPASGVRMENAHDVPLPLPWYLQGLTGPLAAMGFVLVVMLVWYFWNPTGKLRKSVPLNELWEVEQMIKDQISACHRYYQNKAQRKCRKWNKQLETIEQRRWMNK